ncbi:hypothetical protein NPX13_g6339 [Xylaria arbuscula]|uniref:Beta-lactamase-related domain-containing protein n=1 Tax=Xylaria arbuscula TaxID=114810 RepID=A0A9W8NCP9_9PEZI|nr:hypothetical protein NPX13_g6339 [Xylaria arbuscula]
MFGYCSLVARLLIITAIHTAHAKQNCPIYGLGYPKPTNLLNSQGIKNAASALDSVFAQYIDNANNTGSDTFSYSVEVFAASEPTPLWSHYWTAKNLATMNTTGVRKIDGNTVYRIGSLSKIFTILTFLAEVGDSSWNEPIAKFIPEIAAMAANASDNSHSLTSPDWGSITIGALASQISGLMRDYSMLGELTQTSNATQAKAMGLPDLAGSEIPPCGSNPVCTRARKGPSSTPFKKLLVRLNHTSQIPAFPPRPRIDAPNFVYRILPGTPETPAILRALRHASLLGHRLRPPRLRAREDDGEALPAVLRGQAGEAAEPDAHLLQQAGRCPRRDPRRQAEDDVGVQYGE